MTKIAALVRGGEIAAPDILVGGTPCQAFSVAGLRGGLSDPRGALTLAYVELANEIHSARSVRGELSCVVLWENVREILSSKDNAFGCFLAGLAGESCELKPPRGRWANAGCVFGPQRAVAWQVLDAQYFGVAQRRRRVFVVASARDGLDPAAVLFEFDGVRRDIAPSREAGQACPCVTAGAANGGAAHGARSGSAKDNLIVPVHCRDVAQTITSNYGKQVDNSDTALGPNVVAFDATQITSATNRSNPQPGDPCHPLATGAHAPAIAFSSKDYGADATSDLAPTLRAMNHAESHANGGGQMAVAFQSSQSGVRIGETHATLDANNGPRRHNGALVGMQVRRLTPVECERLQAFPDDYTLIPWRKKPASDCPDGLRYKALGNSMCVNVMAWIGRRIATRLS